MIMDSYIVRLWSANEDIRQEEACEQIARHFQGLESDPAPPYLQEQVTRLCTLYDVAALDVAAARAFATDNDMMLAAERLALVEEIPVDSDDAQRTPSDDIVPSTDNDMMLAAEWLALVAEMSVDSDDAQHTPSNDIVPSGEATTLTQEVRDE